MLDNAFVIIYDTGFLTLKLGLSQMKRSEQEQMNFYIRINKAGLLN